MAKQNDRRDHSMIRESGSTAQVLNLAFVYERHGQEADYQENPLFRHRRLNQSVIIKHTVRAEERAFFTYPVATATKVVLPFASTNLRLGGASFLVGQNDLPRLIGGYSETHMLETDLEMLQVLDRCRRLIRS